MNKLDEMWERIQKAQEKTDLSAESKEALADFTDCVERCRIIEDEVRHARAAYWASPQRKALMQHLFGTSTVHQPN